MRFSYITEDQMQEQWPVGCRVMLKNSGPHPTIMTIAPHPDTGLAHNLRFSTEIKSGPAINVRYPKSWKIQNGGWIFSAYLRLVGKCANYTCDH